MDDFDLKKFNGLELVNKSKDTLKETSVDNGNYMTNIELDVINFDKLKEYYVSKYKDKIGIDFKDNERGIKSLDTLILTDNLKLFIEFKNGDISYIDKSDNDKMITEERLKNNISYSVEWKIRDSLLILCDIIDKNISYTRENLDFILVYNQSKNPDRDNMKNYMLKKSGDELVKWGYDKYKIFFRNVHTYTQNQFEKYINDNIAKLKEI